MTREEKARRAFRMSYVREVCPALFEPGVHFTAEQKEQIEQIVRLAQKPPICGQLRSGIRVVQTCQLEPGHKGPHRSNTAAWGHSFQIESEKSWLWLVQARCSGCGSVALLTQVDWSHRALNGPTGRRCGLWDEHLEVYDEAGEVIGRGGFCQGELKRTYEKEPE